MGWNPCVTGPATGLPARNLPHENLAVRPAGAELHKREAEEFGAEPGGGYFGGGFAGEVDAVGAEALVEFATGAGGEIGGEIDDLYAGPQGGLGPHELIQAGRS